MPVDKLGKVVSDVDPTSLTMNVRLQRVICCSKCGETQFTLRRVKDEQGNKVKPSKFICVECYKDESIR